MILRQIVCLGVLTYALAAQDMGKVHFIRASGEASVSAKPDQAQVSIGVISRAVTAEAAAAQNATESSQVLAAVKAALETGGTVKTSGYSISPQYDYSNNHAPKVTGYEASNTVMVTIDQLARLSKVIDAATSTGANNINGIFFTLRDDSGVRAQVLAEAAVKARANAEAIAKALNVRVMGVLQAEPSEAPIVRPMPMMAAKNFVAGAAPATPIESGSLDIRATVTVTLEVQ